MFFFTKTIPKVKCPPSRREGSTSEGNAYIKVIGG